MKKDVVSETMKLLENINKKLEDKLMENYYYDVHISEDEVTGMGYSVFVESDIHFDEDLEAEDIIDLAIEQGKLDSEEAQYCDYVLEINEQEYLDAAPHSSLTEGEQNNDVNEVYNTLKQLEKENDFSSVDKYSDENIHISLYAGDRQEIYGTINSVYKTAKLTTGSGPNPLDPDFLALLNKLSQILKGYKMLHY